MKHLIALTVLLSTQTVFANERGFAFKENMPLDAGSARGKATLTLKNVTLKRGKPFTVDIRFFNSSGGDKFYNPFFNRLIPLPATFAIFDSNKKYIGNLFAFVGGSQRSVNPDDWVSIASSAYVGKEYTFTAGYVPGVTNYVPRITLGAKNDLLPAGKYYLQVIYDKSFIWRGHHGELFRSNVVQIQITD